LGFIRDKVEITGINKCIILTALFDTGAYRNYLKREIGEDLGFHIYEGKHRVILADGETRDAIRVRFKKLKIKNKYIQNPEIILMDNLLDDCIIGSYLMQNIKIILDMDLEKIKIIK